MFLGSAWSLLISAFLNESVRMRYVVGVSLMILSFALFLMS